MPRAVSEHRRRWRKTTRLIPLDFDPICKPAYRGQQLSLFRVIYDTDCDPRSWPPRFRSGTKAVPDDGAPSGWPWADQGRHEDAAEVVSAAVPGGISTALLWTRSDARFAGNAVDSVGAAEVRDLSRGAKGLRIGGCQARHRRHGGSGSKTGAEPAVPAVRAMPVRRSAAQNRQRCLMIKADLALAPGKEPKNYVRFVLTDIRGLWHRLFKRLYCPCGEVETWIREPK